MVSSIKIPHATSLSAFENFVGISNVVMTHYPDINIVLWLF